MTIDASKFLYAVEREYPVSIEALWQAWADPAALEQWYSPTDLAVVPGTVENESVTGGIWTVAVDVSKFGMPNAYFFGRYTEVEPHKLMVHTMHYTQDADEFAARDFESPSHTVVVEFEDRGDSAWCRFNQYGEMPADMIPRTQQGMTSYFDNLEAFLTKTA